MQSINPVIKLFIAALLSSLSVITSDILQLGLLLAFTLLLLYLSKVPLYSYLNRGKYFFELLIVIALLQGMFAKGENMLFYAVGFPITLEGVKVGASVAFRMLIVLLSASLLSSSSPTELVSALVRCGIPYELAFMVYLGLKLVPTLAEELKDSLIAVQLAGADIKKIPLKEKLSIFVYILTPAVAASLSRAKNIAIAAESRGFRAYPKRSFYKSSKMLAKDWYAFIAVGLAGCVYIIFSFGRGLL